MVRCDYYVFIKTCAYWVPYGSKFCVDFENEIDFTFRIYGSLHIYRNVQLF